MGRLTFVYRCGAEFCYICGAKWWTCKCKLWERENIQRVLGADARPGQIEHAINVRGPGRDPLPHFPPGAPFERVRGVHGPGREPHIHHPPGEFAVHARNVHGPDEGHHLHLARPPDWH